MNGRMAAGESQTYLISCLCGLDVRHQDDAPVILGNNLVKSKFNIIGSDRSTIMPFGIYR
jgi:hypothetical protein